MEQPLTPRAIERGIQSVRYAQHVYLLLLFSQGDACVDPSADHSLISESLESLVSVQHTISMPRIIYGCTSPNQLFALTKDLHSFHSPSIVPTLNTQPIVAKINEDKKTIAIVARLAIDTHLARKLVHEGAETSDSHATVPAFQWLPPFQLSLPDYLTMLNRITSNKAHGPWQTLHELVRACQTRLNILREENSTQLQQQLAHVVNIPPSAQWSADMLDILHQEMSRYGQLCDPKNLNWNYIAMRVSIRTGFRVTNLQCSRRSGHSVLKAPPAASTLQNCEPLTVLHNSVEYSAKFRSYIRRLQDAEHIYILFIATSRTCTLLSTTVSTSPSSLLRRVHIDPRRCTSLQQTLSWRKIALAEIASHSRQYPGRNAAIFVKLPLNARLAQTCVADTQTQLLSIDKECISEGDCRKILLARMSQVPISSAASLWQSVEEVMEWVRHHYALLSLSGFKTSHAEDARAKASVEAEEEEAVVGAEEVREEAEAEEAEETAASSSKTTSEECDAPNAPPSRRLVSDKLHFIPKSNQIREDSYKPPSRNKRRVWWCASSSQALQICYFTWRQRMPTVGVAWKWVSWHVSRIAGHLLTPTQCRRRASHASWRSMTPPATFTPPQHLLDSLPNHTTTVRPPSERILAQRRSQAQNVAATFDDEETDVSTVEVEESHEPELLQWLAETFPHDDA